MGLSITLIIVIITGLISYQAFTNREMQSKLLFHPQTVKSKNEYYRFLTAGFVHKDWAHLGMNMFVLYQIGQFIEPTFDSLFGAPYGRVYFLALYLGAIIFGNIPSFLKHQNNGYYSALGASGGTSGVVFAFIIFMPWEWFIFPPLPGIILAVVYLWYSSYMDKKGTDNIGHDAHMWGAVFGLFFTLGIIYLLRPEVMPMLWDALLAGPKMPSF